MIISETITKINLNSIRISKLLKTINDEIAEVSNALYQFNRDRKSNRLSHLEAENRELEKKVEKYKQELIQLRMANNLPHISVNNPSTENKRCDDVQNDAIIEPKKEKPVKKCEPVPLASKSEEVSFGQLDMRVGKILQVEKHPNADSLYVETVEVGEDKPRIIISGLVKHVPIEQMRNRIALFVLNLKPVKMRGISSEGMIMCASTPETCEILSPPIDSIPGDIVTVEGYERKPEPVLNPKKKIFETIATDFFVNEDRIATYKNKSWDVAGKGPAMSQTMVNVKIK